MLPWFAEGRFPLYLAPMAGFTDVVFRRLCKAQGADVMVTEFVMANRFLQERGQDEAWETVDFTPEQRPMGVQIFGSDPANMGEAARVIVDRLRPDFVDINYGCPAPRVVDNCAGSSLLRDLPRLGAVAGAVVKAVSPETPVTAKIRIGWDAQSIVAPEAARILEAEGIQALAVHGRTKEQGYTGAADWGVIEATAAAVAIPVIGNGSIQGPDDVRQRARGGIRGLMIGRAALGYPWIFREIKHCLEHGEAPPPPTLEERWQVILDYGRELANRPVRQARWDTLNWMRPRLKAFTKLIPGARQLRTRLDHVSTYEELEALAEEHLALHRAEMVGGA